MIHFLRNSFFESLVKKNPILFFLISKTLGNIDFLLPNETDWYFFKNIKIKNSHIILDVGAHYGESIKVFRRFFDCNIYSFEPNPRAFKKLKIKTSNFKKIKIFNYGLSSKSFDGVLYTPKIKNFFFDLLSSSNITGVKKNLNRVGFEISKFAFKKDIVKFKKIKKIKMKIPLIKIDVEGSEYDVVMGLNQIIKDNKPILFIEYHENSYHKIYKHLKEYKHFYYDYKNEKLCEFSNISMPINALGRENKALN